MRILLRFKQWRAVLKTEAKTAKLLPMLKALWSGRVDTATYHARIRTCRGCPIYDREFRACRAPNPTGGPRFGCGCYVPFLAKMRAPYPLGCWVRGIAPAMGWPSLPPLPSLWHRLWFVSKSY